MNRQFIGFLFSVMLLLASSACAPATPVNADYVGYTPLPTDTATPLPTATVTVTPVHAPSAEIPLTAHAMKPSDVPPLAALHVYDVQSAGRKRAPYGDSYDLNRFERPYLQDMRYVPDLDIVSFDVSEDADWYYVSILLSGNDPNNKLGLNYGVELDLDADGYGDLLVWGNPVYGRDWTTQGVQVYRDTNHDTAGASAAKSDPGFTGDGYDTLIFDGTIGKGQDSDLAWVRMQGDTEATMEFAFKKTLAGPTFLIGAIADGGLRDVSKLDYNDRFTSSEAGSPIRGYGYYPLKMLYAVDNTCWQAYGMKDPGTVAKVCPADLSEAMATMVPDESAYP
jgi:hypothetical protein